MDFRKFSRICRAAYREERKPLLENEVLGKYDIGSYEEYIELAKSDPIFYEKLREKVREEEAEWSLLFARFDKKRQATEEMSPEMLSSGSFALAYPLSRQPGFGNGGNQGWE